MTLDIGAFRGELKFGGARPSLFEVVLTNPVNNGADQKFTFMCRATQLPGSQLMQIPVAFKGRQIKLAGNRTFEDWNTTIFNDEDFLVRNAVEQWSNAINSFEGNTRTLGDSTPSLFKSTAEVRQLSQTGQVLRTYKFVGIWPMQISAIELDWQSDGQIQEFQVVWPVDYYYVADNTTGDAGGR